MRNALFSLVVCFIVILSAAPASGYDGKFHGNRHGVNYAGVRTEVAQPTAVTKPAKVLEAELRAAPITELSRATPDEGHNLHFHCWLCLFGLALIGNFVFSVIALIIWAVFTVLLRLASS